VQLCNSDGVPEGPCVDEQTPEEEVCDTGERDEDCDGEVNEEGLGCFCGDGYLSAGAGETCDDGGTSDGDPCSPTCQVQTALEVVGGYIHTCALLNDGGVKCWGYNEYGQLGLGDTAHRGDSAGEMGDSLPAVSLGAGKSAVALAAGHAHTCARLNDDSVKCWGLNNYGQLGLGDNDPRGDNTGEMADALPTAKLFSDLW
jgi:cysteine-rich repeat protein